MTSQKELYNFVNRYRKKQTREDTMHVTRRSFIKSSLILTGGLLLPGKEALAKFALQSSNFKLIRGNVGLYTQRGGTIGWLTDDDTVFVVDAQFPDTAKDMYSKLEAKGARKIDYLFNTHHHGDHTSGNYYLGKHTDKIVAQKNCPRLQKEFNAAGDNENEQVYANITFDDVYKVTSGKATVRGYHYNPAHTGGDAVYHFEEANVVHVGDLVFNNIYPYINLDHEATFTGWITYLEKVENLFDTDTVFIFGHADNPDNVYGKKNSLTNMRNQLSAVYELAVKQVQAGKSEEEFAALTEIPGVTWKELWDGARKNVLQQAYREASRG